MFLSFNLIKCNKMKKIFTLVCGALLASAAWADVVTLDLNANINPETLEFGDNGVWTGCYNDVDYTWLEFGEGNYEFLLSHLIDGEGASWGGYYWDGFTPAIGGDQSDYGALMAVMTVAVANAVNSPYIARVYDYLPAPGG